VFNGELGRGCTVHLDNNKLACIIHTVIKEYNYLEIVVSPNDYCEKSKEKLRKSI